MLEKMRFDGGVNLFCHFCGARDFEIHGRRHKPRTPKSFRHRWQEAANDKLKL
jgi:hypothetical protein